VGCAVQRSWCDLRVAIVTFNFDKNRPGGVTNVAKNILQSLTSGLSATIEIISFSNSRLNPESIAILNPSSYRNIRLNQSELFLGSKVTRIGSVGSEFEIMRYRKRSELASYFSNFDLIIVVTGVLQFANVVPRVKVPVIVQCATRLVWERKEQYRAMSRIKRFLLKFQIPVLLIQEKRVLRSKAIFLVENARMSAWVGSESKIQPIMWYPGLISHDPEKEFRTSSRGNGHFISVGRFNEPRKGWERLFIAYKNAFDRDRTLPDLVVAGDGVFSADNKLLLERLIPNYPIKVLGKIDDLERDKQLQSASFFLQTSHEEGLGLAALEALSFGVPLICSETDGSREYVVPGYNGFLISQGTDFISDFTDALLESQHSEHRVLSKNARNLFESRFSNRISQQQLVSIIMKNLTI
jgi:glycosyltransferase involved in cell wall biosynthesis